MKVFGHPLHVIVIHFPSALFPMDLVCSILAYIDSSQSLTDAAFFASFGGVLLGFIAVITGAFDLIPITKEKPGSLQKALVHGSINTTVLIIFMVTTLLAYKSYPNVKPDGIGEIITKGIAILLLAIGNFLGGSLILKDKIGVSK